MDPNAHHNEIGKRRPMFGRVRTVHMVGIGGIGMSSIAEVLIIRGFHVSGSDLESTEVTTRLETLGADVAIGHDARNVRDVDVVVYSSAIDPARNAETREAAHQRIPLIPRSVMLAELMRTKYGVGIAGTHGKTTTTSLVGTVVTHAGLEPTVIVGGKVSALGTNAVAGEGDIIVIEADEYDRTFLRLTPTIAVITSIDTEHLDIYRDLDDIKDAFVTYANTVPFFGAAIVCLDDPNVQDIVRRIERRVITYGTTRQADIRAENISQDGLVSTFDVVTDAGSLGRVSVSLPGHHNVLNTLAAVAVGRELDVAFETIREALTSFRGVQRRFEVIGVVRKICVVDDYAHHPAEVAATLQAAVATWPDRRLVAVFQPHLYSRTRDCADAFGRAFFDADVLIVTDVYPAREAPIAGIDGSLVATAAERFGHRDVSYVPKKDDLVPELVSRLRPGDGVVMMGAGDIWRTSRKLVEALGHAPQNGAHNGADG